MDTKTRCHSGKLANGLMCNLIPSGYRLIRLLVHRKLLGVTVAASLLLAKRLFLEATEYANRKDAISSGIAISLFQDSVEMAVWAAIKEKGIQVKDKESFTDCLAHLNKLEPIAETAKILDLNKARVSFKHNGILPDAYESVKFRVYAEDFLRNVLTKFFDRDFDSLSLVDLVSFPEVRERLARAEQHIENGEFKLAIEELGVARAQLFSALDEFIPPAYRRLSNVDRILDEMGAAIGVHIHDKLTRHLDLMRENLLVSLLRLPLDDYAFLNSILSDMDVMQTANGKWQITFIRARPYDQALCRRLVTCLVNISVHLNVIDSDYFKPHHWRQQ